MVIWEPRKIKPATVSTLSNLFVMKWWDQMTFRCFLNAGKPAFPLSSLTLIKRLFSSSLFSANRVISSAYLSLIFLPAILIPACDSSSLAFHIMYAAWMLNKVTIYSLDILLSQFWSHRSWWLQYICRCPTHTQACYSLDSSNPTILPLSYSV